MARGRRGSDPGTLRLLFFLGQQLARMEQWPPVTLALVAVNVGVYLVPDLLDFVPSVQDACLQPALVMQGRQLGRLLWAGFLHGDDLHVLYNMSSLLYKGSQLEPAMGSPRFAVLIAELLVLAHAFTVLLAGALAAAMPDLAGSYFRSCMIGFSAVLFGLKVVLTAQSPDWTQVAGFHVPSKYASWAELFYIQLISPRASFLGHLGGILAGLFHVYVVQRLRIPQLGPGAGRISWLSQPRTFSGQPRFARTGGVGRHVEMQDAGDNTWPEVPWMEGQRQRAAGLSARRRGAVGSLHRPRWRQMLRWHWSAILLVIVAVLLATNPSEEHFTDYMRHYADRGLGKKAGWAVSSALWLQSRLGISWRYWNYRLFSIARSNSVWFLGAFNRWVPLPSSWLLSKLHQRLSRGVQILAALNILGYLASWILSPRWIVQHCEVALTNLKRRPWSAVLACFVNSSLLSVAINVQVLMNLGPLLQNMLGSVRLAGLYLAGGVLAHLSAVLWQALLACSVVLWPKQKFTVLPDVHLPALWVVGARLALQAAACVRRRRYDNWADILPDLVGSAIGLAVGLYMLI